MAMSNRFMNPATLCADAVVPVLTQQVWYASTSSSVAQLALLMSARQCDYFNACMPLLDSEIE